MLAPTMMDPVSTTSRVVAERLAAQLLSGPPAERVVDVVERLLAVQGQDPRGARLAIRARTTGLTAADVDRALTADRSLVIIWFNRGTLHLVRSEDYWWLHGLTTPPLFTGSARRLAQEGVPPAAAERGVAVIERALTDDGPLTRGQLRERIAGAGVRVEGQALVHILMLASLRGIAVWGPMMGAEHAYVLVRDWLGAPPAMVDRDTALAQLARRYLSGHGPASDRDLAKWAGLPLRDAWHGLSAIGSQLAERHDDLVDLAGRQPHEPLLPPRLLGAFDPLLLGWTSREPLLGPHQAALVTMNGIFRPFALVRGRAVATWGMPDRMVVLTPFARLAPAGAAALAAEAADVERFLASGRGSLVGVTATTQVPRAASVRRWRRRLADEAGRGRALPLAGRPPRRRGPGDPARYRRRRGTARRALGAAAGRRRRPAAARQPADQGARGAGPPVRVGVHPRAGAAGGEPYADADADATRAMAADERVHEEVVRGLAARGRARVSGTFRAAVFGANDGLVSNLALVLGVSGGGVAANTILLTGLAGLLAGPLSMGAGEWISVRSQRELLTASAPGPGTQALVPHLDVDANELALVYRARGMPADEAQRRADVVLGSLEVPPEASSSDALEAVGSDFAAALSSFAFFASGAAMPVLPFAIGLSTGVALVAACLLVGFTLLVTGAIVGVLSGGPPLARALRQLMIGFGAAGITYAVGSLAGAGARLRCRAISAPCSAAGTGTPGVRPPSRG